MDVVQGSQVTLSPYRLMALLNGDAESPAELARRAQVVIQAGASSIQVRCKTSPTSAFLAAAGAAAEICSQTKTPLIVNNRADIAVVCGAWGVHLGPKDLPIAEVKRIVPDSMRVGVSARTPEAAHEAEQQGADYIGCGAVRGTATKPKAQVIGKGGVGRVVKAVSIPVVAIGGIRPTDVSGLLNIGAAGVAVLRPAMSPDPSATVSVYKTALKG